MANIKKLPDAYYKGINGNNYKLLHLNELATEELSKDITDVLNCLDIMQASGKTLDLYGEMLGQKRGVLNDTQYRMMILTKIGKNICQGDYKSVIELLSQMFDCKSSDIILTDSTSETCRVKITKLPLKVLVDAGFSSEQAIQLIEQLLPTCVKVSDGNFEGTFEFGDLTSEEYSCEYDENKGFSDEAQEIGGYLGLLIGDTNGFELPT